jgi:hypothetical protein
MDWTDEAGHLAALQEKINGYLRFIEGGELARKYPKSAGRRVRIDVVLEFVPTPTGVDFLESARRIVEGAGFGLRFARLTHPTASERS